MYHVVNDINCSVTPKMAFLKEWWSGSTQEPKEEEDEQVDEKKETTGGEKGVEESPEGGSEAGTLWNVNFDGQALSKGVGGGLLVAAWILWRIYGCSE